MSEKEYKKHPAYGRILITRITGNVGRLFGSPLKEHNTTLRLRIARGSVSHDLGCDWYSTEGRELIEVTLSPAQFADMLSNMNVGEGTPCTINYVDGKAMPSIPEEEPVEHEKVEESFKKDVAETIQRLREGVRELDAVLTKKSLTIADKDKIRWLVGKALQDVESNAPFMVRQFSEAAVKVVTHAKAEMAAATAGIISRLGLQKLSELKELGRNQTERVLNIPARNLIADEDE